MSATGTLGGFRVAFKHAADMDIPARRIDSPGASDCGGWTRTIKAGEAVTLLPWRRWTVVSGRLWLTHEDDSRDAFPQAGARFESGEHSVVEALVDTVLELGCERRA
jgi:hypothetical protein